MVFMGPFAAVFSKLLITSFFASGTILIAIHLTMHHRQHQQRGQYYHHHSNLIKPFKNQKPEMRPLIRNQKPFNLITANRYAHSVVGTTSYIAPEVYSRKYNHKLDIYSLFLIGVQLFAFDLQSSLSFEAKDSLFKISIRCLYQTLVAMISTPNWRQRPECRQVLATHNEWSIDKNVCHSLFIRSNRIVKLCDFGLATDHNTDGRTASRYTHSVVGTLAYMAPEVLSCSVYNHLSDIYSLSIIGQKLVGIDLNASQTFEAKDSVIKKPLLCLSEILEKMMSTPRWRQRPECRQTSTRHRAVYLMSSTDLSSTPGNNANTNTTLNNMITLFISFGQLFHLNVSISPVGLTIMVIALSSQFIMARPVLDIKYPALCVVLIVLSEK
ncbi:unnamed protein product [Medioppia subpectinata]|uniref:non-specific serine/threonine protein kinase n=1 Tax=Medioppia subpectinata TaxID=1979941 RepID=A0A7R9L3F1_9ACAR|nr:unnamed protein product [Medioppia subpectinata]CAG2114596.1 unnamed protein product [Medioppia subpectinata]